MSQQVRYPSASAVTVAAIGTNLSPIPTQSILIAGENPSLNLQPLQTDASGILKVTATAFPASVGQKTMAQSFPVVIASDQSAVAVTVSGVATAANQATMLTRLSGALVPTAFDEIALTYVPSGAGVGQVQTAVYKLASSTVKTLTLSYDGSDRLSGVVAS